MVQALAHEFGHALGLNHLGEYPATVSNCSLVAPTFWNVGDFCYGCGLQGPQPSDVAGVNAIYD